MQGDTTFWTSHVEACRQEGGAASVYARQHGLTLASLYYWRSKLTLSAAAPESDCVSAKFVALRVMPAATATPNGACTLVLDCGLRLDMAELPSPAWLLALELAHAGAR